MRFRLASRWEQNWGRDGARPSRRRKHCKLAIALCLIALTAQAQEQERKLVDRLLEPNTTLENSAQHKQFNGAGAVTAKSASTRAYYVSNKELAKTFAGTREFTTRPYSSRAFATKDATLPAAPRTKTFATQNARGVSSAREAAKGYDTRKFAGTRRFWNGVRASRRFTPRTARSPSTTSANC